MKGEETDHSFPSGNVPRCKMNPPKERRVLVRRAQWQEREPICKWLEVKRCARSVPGAILAFRYSSSILCPLSVKET